MEGPWEHQHLFLLELFYTWLNIMKSEKCAPTNHYLWYDALWGLTHFDTG